MHFHRHAVASALGLGVALAMFAGVTAAEAAAPTPVYDATPSVLPPNVASLGYEATSTTQFGDYIHLAGTNRLLNTVRVTMSDWAVYSDYSSDARYSANSATWSHPITVNIYSNHLGANGAPDTLIASKTQNVTIPWRPAADPTCAGGTAWRASDASCYNGFAFTAAFDMSSSSTVLPNDLIVGVAFNTADYGTPKIGVPGPYNSLNVGVPTGQTASVGTDDSADKVFWNTSFAGFYADGGVAGVGVFRQDTNWTPNGTVALQITATAALVGPPTNKDQCKGDGWKSFNNPSFKNQGDCVSFVVTGGKHTEDCRSNGWTSLTSPSFKNQGDCENFIGSGGKHVEDCKSNGWKSFNSPSFKNQGDCENFVTTGWRNAGNG